MLSVPTTFIFTKNISLKTNSGHQILQAPRRFGWTVNSLCFRHECYIQLDRKKLLIQKYFKEYKFHLVSNMPYFYNVSPQRDAAKWDCTERHVLFKISMRMGVNFINGKYDEFFVCMLLNLMKIRNPYYTHFLLKHRQICN